MDAQGRPLYPVLLDPGSPVNHIARTSDSRFAFTHLTFDEQKAKWRAEQDSERARQERDARLEAKRKE